MPARLFVVHGSHPCAAVEKALELKGIPYKVFEWTPPTHAVGQRLIFGGRTVPGIRFEDGDRVLGSRAIMAELDRRVAEPPLYPDDRVREADRWGEQVFQPVARHIIWPSLAKDPVALHSFQQGSRLPALPLPVMRDDLAALPEQLDRIDAWVAEGVLDGDGLNAADLQIGATLNLLMALDDLRPLIEPRPAGRLARRIFEPIAGRVPAGMIPAAWLPAKPAAA
jgi:glutathione S-transferase